MPTDTERLDWLATQYGAALINDDFGHWTVAYDGMQNNPADDGPSDIQTTFFVEAAAWHDDIRAALDLAMAEHPLGTLET